MSATNLTTFTYDQIMMTLSAFAYAQASSIKGLLNNNPPPSLPKGATEYATQGNWLLVWGPVTTSANQMYMVYNSTTDEHVIAIRGTVLSFSITTLHDLYEDMAITDPVTWDYPNANGAKIAEGTNTGLNDLLSMTWMGDTLLAYIQHHVVTFSPNSTIYVTGHSLGGCLASVLALWLQYQLTQKKITNPVIPYTFAAPTAGNQAFVNNYNTVFGSNSYRYYDTIDTVPMAWWNIDAIKGLYPSPGSSCTDSIKAAIDVIDEDMKLHHVENFYVQPGTGSGVIPLNGTPTKASFTTEMGDQHDHNNYLFLLNNAPQIPSSITPTMID